MGVFRGTRAPGGRRKNAGRKKLEFLEQCRKIASSPKFLSWAKKVIEYEPVVIKTMPDGSTIKTVADARDVTNLWEKMSAYGYGKPVQALEHSGHDGGPITLAELVSKNAD